MSEPRVFKSATKVVAVDEQGCFCEDFEPTDLIEKSAYDALKTQLAQAEAGYKSALDLLHMTEDKCLKFREERDQLKAELLKYQDAHEERTEERDEWHHKADAWRAEAERLAGVLGQMSKGAWGADCGYGHKEKANQALAEHEAFKEKLK